jgi:hypothetical protein
MDPLEAGYKKFGGWIDSLERIDFLCDALLKNAELLDASLEAFLRETERTPLPPGESCYPPFGMQSMTRHIVDSLMSLVTYIGLKKADDCTSTHSVVH